MSGKFEYETRVYPEACKSIVVEPGEDKGMRFTVGGFKYYATLYCELDNSASHVQVIKTPDRDVYGGVLGDPISDQQVGYITANEGYIYKIDDYRNLIFTQLE